MYLLVYRVGDSSEQVNTLITAINTNSYTECIGFADTILNKIKAGESIRYMSVDNKNEVRILKKNWGVPKLPVMLEIVDQSIVATHYLNDIFIDEFTIELEDGVL
jgi:hypothetical protein